MKSKDSLDTIVEFLNHPYSSKDKGRAFWEECKKNLRLEAWCIGACEVGEFGSELLAYGNGWSDINTPGLVGGVTLGLLYSLGHTYKHGRKHSKNVSLVDAFKYALSAESACVVSATGVEYVLGLATVQNPLSGINLMIRGLGLVPAFGLGLTAMSALTYLHNNEAGRFLTEENALPEVYDYLTNMDENLPLLPSDRRLEIQGTQSFLSVSERSVPRSLRDDSTGKSLYLVKSPVCRYRPESRAVMREAVGNLFRDSGFVVEPVQNIFRH